MPTHRSEPHPDVQKTLDTLLPTLRDLPRDTIRDPLIPVAKMVAEAHALALVATKYSNQLEAVGVARKLHQSLDLRAQAASAAQARLTMVRGRKRSTEEIDQEARGQELRATLVAAGRYATRTNEKAQAALDHIQEGTGLDDLVQDLKELGLFCTTYAADLERIGEQPKALKKECSALADTLQTAVVNRRAGDDEEAQALELRNRAASFLWDAMGEVRSAGAYAFRNDPEVLPLFRSAYRQAHRGPRPGTPDAPVTPNPTG